MIQNSAEPGSGGVAGLPLKTCLGYFEDTNNEKINTEDMVRGD